MRAIYKPRGRAREYAPLAVNLYAGCPHGCLYCYAPACLRRERNDFHRAANPRDGILDALERDAKRISAKSESTGPVLLCFSCDPYPRGCDTQTTREAIDILGRCGFKVSVLTKNPDAARRDFDLFGKYDVEFGVSLIWSNDESRKQWEPNAGHIVERVAALTHASEHGIRTWCSVEPVIDPLQAYHVVRSMRPWVNVWKLGAWNHDARAKAIDYARFLCALMPLLREAEDKKGAAYAIKNDLWAHASESTKREFSQKSEEIK